MDFQPGNQSFSMTSDSMGLEFWPRQQSRPFNLAAALSSISEVALLCAWALINHARNWCMLMYKHRYQHSAVVSISGIKGMYTDIDLDNAPDLEAIFTTICHQIQCTHCRKWSCLFCWILDESRIDATGITLGKVPFGMLLIQHMTFVLSHTEFQGHSFQKLPCHTG